MGPILTLSQGQRERWLPSVDRLARRFDQYAAYQLSPAEYVGEVWMPNGTADVAGLLASSGYEHNGLSALKYHPENGEAHDRGSFRKVPAEHPELDLASEGEPEILGWDPRECQYHVHLFPGSDPGTVELYSHYEVRPDLFSPSFSIQRKREHYRPTYGETYLQGVACEEISSISR